MTPDPSTPPASLSRQGTAREFLTVVFRRRGIILGLFAVTTVTVVILSLTSPVFYISYGRLLVKRGERASALEPYRQVYGDWEQDLASELEVAKSVPVLDRARELLRQEPLPDGRTLSLDARRVGVEVVGKSNVLRLGYEDRDPVVARRACDALLRAYMSFRQQNLGQFSDPKRFFDTELAKVEADLNRQQELRRNYSNKAGLVDVQSQKLNLLNQLAMLKSRESDLKSRVAEARATSQVMRELRDRPEVDWPLPQMAAGYDAISELNRKIVEQEALLARLRERYREEAAEVVSAAETLAKLRQLMSREVEARILVADSRSEVLEAQIAELRTDLADVEAQLETMPDRENKLTEIDRELEILKSRHGALIRNRDLARVTENTTSAITVLLLSPAGPATPSNARDYVRLALAPVFSLVVGIGLAFFFDGLDITVRTASHAEEASDLPVLAAVRERRRPA